MKSKLFIIAAIAGMVLVGCKKKPIEEPGVLTMTTTASGEYNLYITGTGKAEIFWGDGFKADVTLSNLPTDLDDLVYYFVPYNYASTEEKTIKVIGNVLSLYTGGTGEVTALDVSKMPALKVLMCGRENLISLDVSKNTALTFLSCWENNLTNLDVSKNTALTFLSCAANKLENLDVSKNTALTELYCWLNNLTNLDVSKNTALTYLDCGDNNMMTTLTLGTHNALKYLYCADNNLDKDALVDIFHKLPTRMPADNAKIYCGGSYHPNPGYSQLQPADKQIATDKNWSVEDTW